MAMISQAKTFSAKFSQARQKIEFRIKKYGRKIEI
tara:strand:- start:17 stop:121 length:105 start_codon:yes stop_codon:yes gene_type:complete